MLRLHYVNGGYGDSQVLFDLDLTIERGSVLALVGRNGAGKTTTFRTICGQLPLHSGKIMLDGKPIGGMPPHGVAQAGVGFVPEDRQVFGELTVHDNIVLGAKRAVDGSITWDEHNIYEVFPPLARLKTRLAGRLSGGEQQMLTMARALMGNPSLLLLDEPSEGLAPVIVSAIAELIRTITGNGMTVVMAEQNIAFCMMVATRAAIIERGRIVYHDEMADLISNDEMKRRHLAV